MTLRYIALIVLVLAVAGCNSGGSAQPSPSGAIPSGQAFADSAICGSAPSQGPGPFINNQLPHATPALVTLVQNWEQAWGAVNGAGDTAEQGTLDSDGDAITAWCASNGFD